jgi:hypothetical protein
MALAINRGEPIVTADRKLAAIARAKGLVVELIVRG